MECVGRDSSAVARPSWHGYRELEAREQLHDDACYHVAPGDVELVIGCFGHDCCVCLLCIAVVVVRFEAKVWLEKD